MYAVLGQGENALQYAESCLHRCLENSIDDLDLAFAYEAVSRAYAVLDDQNMFKKYFDLAKDSGEKIAKADDKKYFFAELNTISEL